MSPVRPQHVSIHTLWARLSRAGKVGLAIIALAIIVLASPVLAMIGSLLTPAASPTGAQDSRRQEMLKKFEESSERSLAQTNGRSLFVIPAAPRPPRNDPPPTPTDTTPHPPSSYGGPAIAAIINDTVWFSDGTRLKPGENADKPLSVVRLDPPWGATVRYRGVDFAVTLFERDKTVIPPPPPPPKAEQAKSPDAPPVPGAPSEAKPGEAPDTKPESKPGSAPDSKPESKPEAGPAPAPGANPQPAPENPATTPAPRTSGVQQVGNP